jgi:hypothetical protein
MVSKIKHCGGCGQDKPLSAFNKRSGTKSGVQSRCKECQVKSATKWAKDNPAEHSAAYARYRRKSLYGVTEEQFQAMLKGQNNACGICKKVKPLGVDHNHTTGKVRGLLCQKCNHAIGLLDEDPKCFDEAKVWISIS